MSDTTGAATLRPLDAPRSLAEDAADRIREQIHHMIGIKAAHIRFAARKCRFDRHARSFLMPHRAIQPDARRAHADRGDTGPVKGRDGAGEQEPGVASASSELNRHCERRTRAAIQVGLIRSWIASPDIRRTRNDELFNGADQTLVIVPASLKRVGTAHH